MGRGVSSGGGQSSLGYLFGSGEPGKPATNHTPPPENPVAVISDGPPPKPSASALDVDRAKQVPAGIHSTASNNYHRADGQNTGNFITVVGLLWAIFSVAVRATESDTIFRARMGRREVCFHFSYDR